VAQTDALPATPTEGGGGGRTTNMALPSTAPRSLFLFPYLTTVPSLVAFLPLPSHSPTCPTRKRHRRAAAGHSTYPSLAACQPVNSSLCHLHGHGGRRRRAAAISSGTLSSTLYRFFSLLFCCCCCPSRSCLPPGAHAAFLAPALRALTPLLAEPLAWAAALGAVALFA